MTYNFFLNFQLKNNNKEIDDFLKNPIDSRDIKLIENLDFSNNKMDFINFEENKNKIIKKWNQKLSKINNNSINDDFNSKIPQIFKRNLNSKIDLNPNNLNQIKSDNINLPKLRKNEIPSHRKLPKKLFQKIKPFKLS